MAKYLKPQTPLQHQSGDYIYPITTVDQVITAKGERLNANLINVDLNESVESDTNINLINNKPKAGFIYPLASNVVPEGFLLCDGAEYLRAEYPELFAAIGTMYGAGDGSSTFNVPNLQNNNMQPYTINYIIATGKDTGVNVADIITGVQALPLGVEYGGTGATNIVDARKNLGIDNYMELLWENANASSTFPSQTINLDLSEYKYIEITYNYGTAASNQMYSSTCSVGVSSYLLMFEDIIYPDTLNGFNVKARKLSVKQTSIAFDGGTIFGIFNGAINVKRDNDILIPVKIYGIKGVSV